MVQNVFYSYLFSFLFNDVQRGLDALPGMTILSACLEAVSEFGSNYYAKIMILALGLELTGSFIKIDFKYWTELILLSL